MTPTRVLVVEDENLVALEIADLLRALGYVACGMASSGEAAIELAGQTGPDLILMDIRLRGNLDGVEAAGQIRQHSDIPVVYLTAYTDDATLRRAKLTEPYGYLIKPFEERELHTAIEMALYKHTMEKRLKESERWLAATLKSIGDAVVATDPRGAIVFINRQAQALIGCPAQEVLGQDLDGVLRLYQEGTRTPIDHPVASVLRAGAEIVAGDNMFLVARDGAEIPVDLSASPLRDESGQMAGVVVVFRDITERKRVEAENAGLYRELQRHAGELAVALAELRELDRLKSEFMQNVTHELRTPLALVLGYTELLVEGECGPLEPVHHEMLTLVKRQVQSLCSMVDDIGLTLLVQLQEPQREPVDLTELACIAVENHCEQARNAQLTLSAEIDPDLPLVNGAPVFLRRLLDNLLSNAIKFTPAGGAVDVRVRRNGNRILLAVSDSGIGIPPGEQQRIFDRFYQVDGKMNRRYNGMGLGLALVKEIVEAHGGTVGVESQVGKGSTFTVGLPTSGPDGKASGSDGKAHALKGTAPFVRGRILPAEQTVYQDGAHPSALVLPVGGSIPRSV
jgi:PAS domain S-box-containing protein